MAAKKADFLKKKKKNMSMPVLILDVANKTKHFPLKQTKNYIPFFPIDHFKLEIHYCKCVQSSTTTWVHVVS